EIEVPIIEIIETEKVESVIPIITEQNTYYIIAGAFAEQKNANKMLQKLKRWNYDASIVEGENLMRVSYNSFSKKEEAIMALAEIRKDNKSAWLLTK
ncbi:MAG: SPOR domain-containing protein, partial [Bacteroidota bacterium]|nr:SPOR domain-containing protein [Bacteroidota bacterium]